MALAISLLVAGITAVSVFLFWSRIWWFPPNISVHGDAMDQQMILTLICAGVIFVLAQLGLAYFIWRHREGSGRQAIYSHGNDKLEVTWTVATAVFFIGLGILAQDIWAKIYYTEAPPGALRIQVTGKQFAWNFRYPGPDGKFGPMRLNLVDDAAANPLGLDIDNDPDSADDIVVPNMAIPVNRPVELLLHAMDVTHSYWVRELRVKQDLVPGLNLKVHFIATQVGRYEIACAELCGLGHHTMRAFLDVMSEVDYAQWLEDRAAEQ